MTTEYDSLRHRLEAAEAERRQYVALHAREQGLRQQLEAENAALSALLAECQRERDAALNELKITEWIFDDFYGDYFCPRCYAWKKHNHHPDCARQRALGLADKNIG